LRRNSDRGECGDDAKENDGLQQVVRSALADVD